MAVVFVLLLSCLTYGVIANPPANSYQGPAVSAPVRSSGLASSHLATNRHVVGGRPAGQATRHSVSNLNAQRPIASGTSTKRVIGGRPTGHGIGHSASTLNAQRPIGRHAGQVSGTRTLNRPIASGTSGKHISSPSVGSGRPISTGRQHGSHKTGTVGSHGPY